MNNPWRKHLCCVVFAYHWDSILIWLWGWLAYAQLCIIGLVEIETIMLLLCIKNLLKMGIFDEYESLGLQKIQNIHEKNAMPCRNPMNNFNRKLFPCIFLFLYCILKMEHWRVNWRMLTPSLRMKFLFSRLFFYI